MTEESDKKLQWYKNRFNPERYQISGTSKWGPNDVVPQISGLYAFPRGDDLREREEDSSSSEDE